MKFSVLIPIYIKEKPTYLRECLNSIIHQTLPPDQIVIFKDGEITQELEAVLKEYQDKIEVYGYAEQKGVGGALKEGIHYCREEYIARMDADDIAIKDRFAWQVDFLKKHPEVDIVGGYIEEYDETMQKKLSLRKVPLKEAEIREFIKTKCPFNHGTIMVKKSKIIECGNYRSVALEDYDLWIRMMLQGCHMRNIDKVLLKYRTGNNMYKRRGGISYFKEVISIEKQLWKSGIIQKKEYRKNCIMRGMLALTPVPIRKIVYQKIVHK